MGARRRPEDAAARRLAAGAGGRRARTDRERRDQIRGRACGERARRARLRAGEPGVPTEMTAMLSISRRRMVSTLLALAASGALPRLALAALPTERRTIVILLRGALDGLAAVPPYGDPDYAGQRG